VLSRLRARRGPGPLVARALLVLLLPLQLPAQPAPSARDLELRRRLEHYATLPAGEREVLAPSLATLVWGEESGLFDPGASTRAWQEGRARLQEAMAAAPAGTFRPLLEELEARRDRWRVQKGLRGVGVFLSGVVAVSALSMAVFSLSLPALVVAGLAPYLDASAAVSGARPGRPGLRRPPRGGLAAPPPGGPRRAQPVHTHSTVAASPGSGASSRRPIRFRIASGTGRARAALRRSSTSQGASR